MATGLQSDVQGSALQKRFIRHGINGPDFGMRPPEGTGKTFSNNFIIIGDYRTYHGVGSSSSQTVFGDLKAA
jgi:hypothetical protein